MFFFCSKVLTGILWCRTHSQNDKMWSWICIRTHNILQNIYKIKRVIIDSLFIFLTNSKVILNLSFVYQNILIYFLPPQIHLKVRFGLVDNFK